MKGKFRLYGGIVELPFGEWTLSTTIELDMELPNATTYTPELSEAIQAALDQWILVVKAK